MRRAAKRKTLYVIMRDQDAVRSLSLTGHPLATNAKRCNKNPMGGPDRSTAARAAVAVRSRGISAIRGAARFPASPAHRCQRLAKASSDFATATVAALQMTAGNRSRMPFSPNVATST